MKYLYIRCNGGHYYRSTITCPFDGWSCDGLELATEVFERLNGRPADTSIDALRKNGVFEAVLERLLVIEFGNEASAFQALVPERYLHNGSEVLAGSTDLSLF